MKNIKEKVTWNNNSPIPHCKIEKVFSQDCIINTCVCRHIASFFCQLGIYSMKVK